MLLLQSLVLGRDDEDEATRGAYWDHGPPPRRHHRLRGRHSRLGVSFSLCEGGAAREKREPRVWEYFTLKVKRIYINLYFIIAFFAALIIEPNLAKLPTIHFALWCVQHIIL